MRTSIEAIRRQGLIKDDAHRRPENGWLEKWVGKPRQPFDVG